MLDALTARAALIPASVGAPGGTLNAPTVIDASDTSVDLAWLSIGGTATYRVWRADLNGPFAVVGDVAGPSFGDSDLTPHSTYRWHIMAVVNGVEGPVSVDTAATTRPTPLRRSRHVPDWQMKKTQAAVQPNHKSIGPRNPLRAFRQRSNQLCRRAL
jgi:hypothetical protein